jgi:hypothetical protein
MEDEVEMMGKEKALTFSRYCPPFVWSYWRRPRNFLEIIFGVPISIRN